MRPFVFFTRAAAAVAPAVLLLVAVAVADAASAADGKVTVQWFGQSAFKITSPGGKVIMVDPFITKNPKTPPELKDLVALGKVDLVKLGWDRAGSSIWPAKQFGSLVQPGKYLLRLDIEILGEEKPRWVRSGEVPVTVTKCTCLPTRLRQARPMLRQS